MLTESDKVTINSFAKKWDVKPDIHPDDFIFRFLYDNPTFLSKDAAIQYYFNDGQKSAQQLSGILIEICKHDGKQKIDLLEFASGYGCVTRHLENVIPFAQVTTCDIHSEAQAFIKNKLNVNAVLSVPQPEKLILDKKYDVVFALSFFSHMPKATFGRWLNQLSSLVKPGGCVIFTTHGLNSRKVLPKVQFDEDGFWFQPSSEQKDLDTSEYGLTCTRPEYVFSRLFEEPQNRLLYYHEAFWWGHQDVYVVKRDIDNTSRKIHIRANRTLDSLANKLKRMVHNLRGNGA
jgi:SAM-dependent methyltransferase